MKPNILLVDNHKDYREALREILANDPDIGNVTEAGGGVEALAKASETAPDVVCVDVTMPHMNGIDTTRQLVAGQPGVRVIAISTHVIKEYILEMLKAGALAYLVKDEVGGHLLHAVQAVLKRQNYLCPSAAAALADTQQAFS